MKAENRDTPLPDPLIRAPLERVAFRQRRLRFWCKLAACWAGAAFLGLLLFGLERLTGWASSLVLPLVALVGMVAAVVVTVRHGGAGPDWREIARRIEAAYPELDGKLLTAVQQQGKPGAELNYLQQRLLQQALLHSHSRDWTITISQSRLVLAQTAHWLAVIMLTLVLWGLRTTGGTSLLARIPATGLSVNPGDTSLERGSSLVVLARFGAPVPATVQMVVTPAIGGAQHIPLTRTLADPVFGGMVPEVTSNFVYHVEYNGRKSRPFKVTVFEYPRLERADVELSFPEYTGQEPKRIPDTRRVSAVEGTSLDLTLQLNKPVVSARLLAKEGATAAIPLIIASNRPVATLQQFPLSASSTYELQLIDSDGRTNKAAAQFVFNVSKNNGPEMKLAMPRGDVRPSPLEEISFEGTVWDDFGIQSYGLGYTVGGEETKFIELGGTVPAKEKRSFQHVLRLEDLEVRPDQLVAWFVWADDTAADGQTRRVTGDLFFAETRPFDEIFREAEGAEGGQSQPGGQRGSQSAKLAELQKQIINATWKIQREHGRGAAPGSRPQPGPARSKTNPPTGQVPGPDTSGKASFSDRQKLRSLDGSRLVFGQPARPSSDGAVVSPRPRTGERRGVDRAKAPTYSEDLTVVKDSLGQVLEQAEAASQEQDDPRTAELWKAAIRELEKAGERLNAASNSPALLTEAIASERAAYQALLKLQQHEYQVTRNRQRNQGGGGGGSREQQMQLQLEQMDLTRSENRYETQRQAQPQQDAERREDLQVMNRLQELARRQQDLNERLKELQSALQEARTEEEREEIRRRLKRLQEEEQQMLADVDEVRQRMEQPENQSRMTEERRQLEQTRDEIQRASEAAAQGSASQALASGTRAQRQLQEMRDQMRKQNSSKFSDDLREMRAEARDLAREQEQLLQKMNQEAANQKKALSDSPERQQLLEELARQRQRMTNVLERATQVSQDAEPSEPLLSRQLYDTLRKFSQDNSSGLKQTQEELIERGMMTPGMYELLKENTDQEGVRLLDLTAEMLRQDFLPQARQTGQRSQGGIDELKRGVERAADSVIGDDTEALKLAQAELDRVMEQLQREMAQAEGAGGTNRLQAGTGRTPGGTNQVNGSEGEPGPGKATAQGEPSAEGRDPSASAPATEQANNGQQPGQRGESTQPGEQPGPGGQAASDAQAGEGQGQGQRQANSDQAQAEGGRPSPESGRAQTSGEQGRNAQRGGTRTDDGGLGGLLGGSWDRLLRENGGRETGPLIGEDFAPWSDRLRSVEEMVDVPDLRNEVAAARERARLMRQEYKREGKKPDWAMVRLQVIKPLVEVRDRIAEELARRQSDKALVPIDRYPVPSRYSERVRRYYEELGKNQ